MLFSLLAFRLQVGLVAQGFHALSLPCYMGIKLRRFAAHIDAIAVTDQVTRSRLERERLPQLSADPGRSWCGRNVEVDDKSSGVAQDDEDIELPVRNLGNHKEIHRGQRTGVVGQEGTPRLRGWLAMMWPPHVLGDARLGDRMPQETQLRLNAWRAPEWILAGHTLDERLDVLGQRRSSDSLRARLPAPPQAEALLMPANDGLRLHHDERRSPA